MKDKKYFAKYIQFVGRGFCISPRWHSLWFRNDLYCSPIYFPAFDDRVEISETPFKRLKIGYTYTAPKYKEELADNIIGSLEELETYRYNVYSNNIFPFINICLTDAQNNNSLSYIPFLSDKRYNDNEIYKKFNLTEEEIDLIESTIKKYNKNSVYFKRLQEGKEWEKYCNDKDEI